MTHGAAAQLRWAVIVLLAALTACGKSNPTALDNLPSEIVQLGPQLLVIQHYPGVPSCGVPERRFPGS
jgi:hypothetical protein